MESDYEKKEWAIEKVGPDLYECGPRMARMFEDEAAEKKRKASFWWRLTHGRFCGGYVV